ncbi:MAG: sigma-54-dependent Fis family transcriptional regulator [Calditrichaeota bacterium]|nr:sigma-54-dependent Fis family transcriptional regulator [Calditrichota bacterium]
MIDESRKSLYDFGELKILIVDDQADIRNGLKRLLSTLGCEVDVCSSGEEAMAALIKDHFDIVFTDLKMEGMSGTDLLNEITRRWTDIEVVLITGFGTIELAVSCLQNGASHFITKPFDNKEILAYVQRIGYKILSRKQAQNRLNKFKTHTLIAIDPRMREVLELVNQVAPSRIPVLIEGASGTGKELIAHEIHQRSPLKDKPFLAINCIALPDTLLESELFGYKKGAFTGAYKDSKGLFEQVNGGTIFLDEVSSMSLMFQGKLLRVLQEKVIRPLGGNEDVSVDFRLIAASNKNLEEMVKKGQFREDLYYRLQVVKINLPALNERPQCIPALAEYFLERASNELLGKDVEKPKLSPAAIEALKQHQWKGNVRELENTIQRALIVCKGDKILPSHLGFNDDLPPVDDLFDEFVSYEEGKRKAIEQFQRTFILNALNKTNGNISRAAELCGITRAAFQRIMRKLNLQV